MMNNSNSPKQIILERNDEEERNLNYTKIYNLSKIDMLQEIDIEKKNILLKTIKTILLCTNKYIELFDKKEMINNIFSSIILFIIYILIISPTINYCFLTEEESHKLEYFGISQKLFYFSISKLIGFIFRFMYSSYRQDKLLNIFLYFARNELNKIKKYFIIDINDNFDLTINCANNNDDDENKKDEEKEEVDNFYQYVICYPNGRLPKWDQNILSDKENKIYNETLNGVRNIQGHVKLKSLFIIFLNLGLFFYSLYLLTIAKIRTYFIFYIISFIFSKIGTTIVDVRIKKLSIINEECANKMYIPQGYFVSFNTCMIEIFKLNSQYENITDENEIIEVYKKLSKLINDINSKFNIENKYIK